MEVVTPPIPEIKGPDQRQQEFDIAFAGIVRHYERSITASEDTPQEPLPPVEADDETLEVLQEEHPNIPDLRE